MHKLLYIGSKDHYDELLGIVDAEISLCEPDNAVRIFEKDHSFSTVIIEYPSDLKGIGMLTKYITEGNNYIFSTAVIIITDDAHYDKDIAFLGGAVVDAVMKPVRKEILMNRIDNAEKLVNSVSFHEFARMLKVLPANIYLKDANGKYVFSSQTWHHLDTGDDPNWTIKGKTDLEIRNDKENAKLAYESDMEMIRTGKGTSYIIEENDNGQEFLQLIKEPLFFEDGRVRGIIALINNVTEQELLRRKLKERSVRDELTGLYNRSYLDEFMLEIKDKGAYPMCIISADCDCLKKVNDNYGHMIGDEYIRICVTLMKTILPENSTIFRMGGDEFMAFIPGVGKQEGEQLISDMKKNASSYTIKDITLSVSLGYGIVENENVSIVECMKRSDADMYRDKRRRKKQRTP